MGTAKKVTVFGSFVVDLMARTPCLPVPDETVKGTYFKQGAGGKGFKSGHRSTQVGWKRDHGNEAWTRFVSSGCRACHG